MIGAVMNEQLRLMPAILNVPKRSNGDHVIKMDGQEFVVPKETYLHLKV